METMMRLLVGLVPLALATAAQAQEVDALYCQRGGAETLSVRTDGSALDFAVEYWGDNDHSFGLSGRAVDGGPNAWVFREGRCTATITLADAFLLQFDGCEMFGGARAQPASLRFDTPVSRSRSLSLEGPPPC